jgi:hypothetical protein
MIYWVRSVADTHYFCDFFENSGISVISRATVYDFGEAEAGEDLASEAVQGDLCSGCSGGKGFQPLGEGITNREDVLMTSVGQANGADVVE